MVGSRAASASVLMRTRLVFMSASAKTYSASARPLSASKADAISSAFRISSVTTSRPNAPAAAWTSPTSFMAAGLSALIRIANRRRLGTTSRKSSSRFPARSVNWTDRPVTLPPGRARLATMPVPTGSPAPAKTIGMSAVACFAARAGRVPTVTIDLELDKLGRNLGEAFGASLGPAILDRDAAALEPAEFVQSLHKSAEPLTLDQRRGCAQEPNGRQLPRLLRARRERPRRGAAECDQQFPSSDRDCHTPLPRRVRKGNGTTPPACSLHVQGGLDSGAGCTAKDELRSPLSPLASKVRRNGSRPVLRCHLANRALAKTVFLASSMTVAA